MVYEGPKYRSEPEDWHRKSSQLLRNNIPRTTIQKVIAKFERHESSRATHSVCIFMLVETHFHLR